MSESTPLLKVFHVGKLNGRYMCKECLFDRNRRHLSYAESHPPKNVKKIENPSL